MRVWHPLLIQSKLVAGNWGLINPSFWLDPSLCCLCSPATHPALKKHWDVSSSSRNSPCCHLCAVFFPNLVVTVKVSCTVGALRGAAALVLPGEGGWRPG